MTLSGENLRKRYGKREVLKGVSIKVEEGKIVGLLGPNGAGKTTLLKILAGLQRPNSGCVRLNGKDITSLPLWKRVRLGIAFLPQESTLFEELSVRDNIRLACEIAGEKFEATKDILDFFGILKVLDQKANEISGGERRKVDIARVMILKPAFLLLDEPFAGIDPKSIQEIAGMLENLAQRNIGILISDHNVRDVLKICNRVYLIYDGEVVEEGAPSDIVSSKRVRSIFLGEGFSL